MSAKPCPACGNEEFIKSRMTALRFRGGLCLPVIECTGCGHRWLNLADGDLAGIEANYKTDYPGFRIDEYFSSVVLAELRTRLRPFLPPGSRLLDVGCGNGEFLVAAAKSEIICEGIDVSSDGVQIAQSKGMKATAADFLTHSFEHRFDCVTFWDVAEHLESPFDFLCRAAGLLRDNGVVIVKVPAYGSLNFHLLSFFRGLGGVLLNAPGHMQFYTQGSLECLLGRAGFREIVWLPNISFRSKRPSNSFRKGLGRQVRNYVGKAAGNCNYYVVAAKEPISGEIKEAFNDNSVGRLRETVD